MGAVVRYLLAELLEGSGIYTVQPAGDGYDFTPVESRLQEFSDLVRRASEAAGNEYLVFPTAAGPGLYCGMYILPMPSQGPYARDLR